jgi:hypothetical protein
MNSDIHLTLHHKGYTCIKMKLTETVLNCDTPLASRRPRFSLLALTPWRRVLEKLTVTQLVKQFPAIYGIRRNITVYNDPRPEPDASSPHLRILFL